MRGGAVLAVAFEADQGGGLGHEDREVAIANAPGPVAVSRDFLIVRAGEQGSCHNAKVRGRPGDLVLPRKGVKPDGEHGSPPNRPGEGGTYTYCPIFSAILVPMLSLPGEPGFAV